MNNKGKNTEFNNDSDNTIESPKDSIDTGTCSTRSTIIRFEQRFPQAPHNTPCSSNGNIPTTDSSNGNGGSGSGASGGSGFGGWFTNLIENLF